MRSSSFPGSSTPLAPGQRYTCSTSSRPHNTDPPSCSPHEDDDDDDRPNDLAPYRLFPIERGSPTEFIRKALANTQWPSSTLPQKPVIRYTFDRASEAFASPRADLVPLATAKDLDGAAATLPSSAQAAEPLAPAPVPASAASIAPAIPAPLAPPGQSPAEGYFSESVDSPASARDFLASPSLFDDCDFDFVGDDTGALVPLFPGTTFDSQVDGALPHEHGFGPVDHRQYKDQDEPPCSPPLVDEMDNTQSTSPQQQPSQQRLASGDGHGLMYDELRKEGLSCYVVNPDDTSTIVSQASFGSGLYAGASTPPKTEDDFSTTSASIEHHLRTLMADISALNSQRYLAQSLQDAFDGEGPMALPEASPAIASAQHIPAAPHDQADDLMSKAGSAFSTQECAAIVSDHDIKPELSAFDRHLTLYESTPDTKDGAVVARLASPDASVEDDHRSNDGQIVDYITATGSNPRKRTYSVVSSSVATPDRDSASSNKRANTAGFKSSTPSSARLPKGRRFQCEVCQKWFDRAFNLKTHMFTHQDPNARSKNFVCPDPACSKAFARKHDMNRHYSTVHLKTMKRTSRKSPNRTSPTQSERDDDQG